MWAFFLLNILIESCFALCNSWSCCHYQHFFFFFLHSLVIISAVLLLPGQSVRTQQKTVTDIEGHSSPNSSTGDIVVWKHQNESFYLCAPCIKGLLVTFCQYAVMREMLFVFMIMASWRSLTQVSLWGDSDTGLLSTETVHLSTEQPVLFFCPHQLPVNMQMTTLFQRIPVLSSNW